MTSRLAQTLALCIALAALIGPTSAGARTSSAPTGLHPFLLRVDEPASRSFTRTPGFAWNPVKGAQRYEFQLSTSASFRESGVVYSDTSLTSPVASPALTLPWITGSPHALYARVRAVLADSTTAWSNAYGFDMEPAAVPSPLASTGPAPLDPGRRRRRLPGVVRRRAEDGADADERRRPAGVLLVPPGGLVARPGAVADQGAARRLQHSARTACLPSHTARGARSTARSTRRSQSAR